VQNLLIPKSINLILKLKHIVLQNPLTKKTFCDIQLDFYVLKSTAIKYGCKLIPSTPFDKLPEKQEHGAICRWLHGKD